MKDFDSQVWGFASNTTEAELLLSVEKKIMKFIQL